MNPESCKRYFLSFLVFVVSIMHGVVFATSPDKSVNKEATEQLGEMIQNLKETDVNSVKELLLSGADVNVRTKSGRAIIHAATERGFNEIVRLLILSGADVNLRNTEYGIFHAGTTPIFYASHNGDLETVRLLLEHHAKVNIANEINDTPLHYATEENYSNDIKTEQNRHEIIKLLLNAGANTNAVSSNGRTPLYNLLLRNNTFLESFKTLLNAGTDVNQTYENNETLLFKAAIFGFTKRADLLIKKGANVNISLKSNQQVKYILADPESMLGHPHYLNSETTPLLAAVSIDGEYSSRVAIIKMLLAVKSTDVNRADAEGLTPLILAANYGRYEVVRMLLEAKADPNIKINYEGGKYTAINFAKGKDQEKIINLLKSYSAQ